MLGMASRILNAMTGGVWPQTLCYRWARAWGVDCLPCRIIGRVLGQPDHCAEELQSTDKD